jgi:6-phosphogluconolactonase (cycloisomerase 2 family)
MTDEGGLVLRTAIRATLFAGLMALTACGGGGGGDDGGFSNPPSFTVGGSVSGLTGTGLVLQNSGGSNLSVTGNGAFTFSQSVQTNTSYAVTVLTQPTNPAQTCTVSGGSGTVSGANVTNVSVTCTGQVAKFLYVPNAGSNTVSGFSVNKDTGALTAVAGSPFATDTTPFFASWDRGTRLFVTNEGPPSTSEYTINTTSGALTQVTGSPFHLSVAAPPPSNPGAIGDVLLNSTGTFGYVGLPATGKLYGFTVNATSGNLNEIAGFPVNPGALLGNPVFNSSGTALYLPYDTMNGGPGNVAVYVVNAGSGVLTPQGTVPTGGVGVNFASLDNSGKFLLVPNVSSGTLAVFSVDATNGMLTAVAGSPFNTGAANRTGGLAIHRSKNFVYATNNNDAVAGTFSTIAGFTIDASTGVLVPIPGSPFPTGGIGSNLAAIDPTGKFLYVANSGSDNITGFTIDQTSGALTAIPGSPFAAGDRPLAVAIDPSGRYLYVPNTNSGNVQSFAINGTSGVLTSIGALASGANTSIIEIVGLQ